MFSNEPNRGRGAISPETMDESKNEQNAKNPNDQDKKDPKGFIGKK